MSFVEKPAPERAAELPHEGALWSSFMFTASATSLVRACERALLRSRTPTRIAAQQAERFPSTAPLFQLAS